MTVNFYLNIKPKQTEHTIFLYIRGIGGTIKYHTGENIAHKYWDSKKQIVKQGYKGSPELNLFLNQLKETVWITYRSLITVKKKVSYHEIKDAILNALKNEEPIDNSETLIKVYNSFIKTKNDQVTFRTIQKYKTLKDHLLSFSKNKKYELTFDTVDLSFYDKFISFLIHDRKLTNNTIGKYVSTFKTFMHWATDRGHNNKMDFIKFKVFEEKTDIIYLLWDELMKLYNHDFSNKPHLNNVRDAFCFQCFTGQRFSDISSLTWDNIKGKSWFLRTMKTRDPIEIPLNEYALSILRKYKEQEYPLPIISHQKTNDYIKNACKEAGIDDIITSVKYIGTKKIETKHLKYELISTHDARRTFVTLSLEKGMRPETVMEITGHTDYKTMKKYIKITSKVKHREMSDVWKK